MVVGSEAEALTKKPETRKRKRKRLKVDRFRISSRRRRRELRSSLRLARAAIDFCFGALFIIVGFQSNLYLWTPHTSICWVLLSVSSNSQTEYRIFHFSQIPPQ